MDYYGLSLGVDILPGSVFINMFMSALIEFPSYLMACVLLNKVGSSARDCYVAVPGVTGPQHDHTTTGCTSVLGGRAVVLKFQDHSMTKQCGRAVVLVALWSCYRCRRVNAFLISCTW